MIRRLFILPLLALLIGCAHYEYDIVRPPNLGHISGDKETVIHFHPLEYRLQAVENQLVMRIFNPTSDPIQLLGDKSAAIDPHKQAHPLPSQTIFPGSYIELILPLPVPRTAHYGPTWGMGVGAYNRIEYRRENGLIDTPDDSADYVEYPEGADVFHWTWPGESEARIILVFQRNKKTFRDEFVFHRVKM